MDRNVDISTGSMFRFMNSYSMIVVNLFTEKFKDLDNIIVIDNGTIAETGKHEELLSSNNSLYKRMYELQNK